MMDDTLKVGELTCEFPHSRPGGRDQPGSCGASPTNRDSLSRPIWAVFASGSSRTLKHGNVRRPLKVGIREQMKASLLIPPSGDHEASTPFVSWAAMAGQCVLIETECVAWVDWGSARVRREET
jgi:hypothetical protein